MGAENAYTKTSVAGIAGTLKGLFTSLEGQGDYKRSANTNMILLVGGVKELERVEGLLESLSLTHPSRFFLLYSDAKLGGLETSVAAKCLLVAKSEHVCCEVVRIGVPNEKNLAEAKSVVQANLLTGMSTDLFLYYPATSLQTVDLLAPLADTLFFDSRALEREQEKINHISRMPLTLVDFEWVRLADWRDAVKAIFDRGAVMSLLPFTRSIRVVASATGGTNAASMAGLLLTGWIVSRLGLQVHGYSSRSGFECKDSSGRSVKLDLLFASDSNETQPLEIAFHFERQTTHSGDPHVIMERESADRLEISVDVGGQSFNTSRSLDSGEISNFIVRYFSVGESIANYRAALRKGLELESLRRGKGLPN